jgi:hypothetical protein
LFQILTFLKNFGKYVLNFAFKANFFLKKAFRILKPEAKKEIRGGKKRCGRGREIIFLVDLSLEGPKSLLRVTIIDLGFELKKKLL